MTFTVLDGRADTSITVIAAGSEGHFPRALCRKVALPLHDGFLLASPAKYDDAHGFRSAVLSIPIHLLYTNHHCMMMGVKTSISAWIAGSSLSKKLRNRFPDRITGRYRHIKIYAMQQSVLDHHEKTKSKLVTS